MSYPVPSAPQCHQCGTYLQPPGHYCGFCSAPQPQFMPVHYGPMPVATIGAKSPGIAVLLTFLWLGAGHLYADRTVTGILLIVYDCFLVLLSLTIIGLIITVPLWLISTPITMIFAAGAASDFNRRNGIVVR